MNEPDIQLTLNNMTPEERKKAAELLKRMLNSNEEFAPISCSDDLVAHTDGLVVTRKKDSAESV